MLIDVLVFLTGAVIAVPLFKRLGLGAVLGYLVAGVLIGPWGLRLISDVDNTLHFAELGVVLLLFIIGLELQPSRLWALRRLVFGYGGAQWLLTGSLIAGGAYGLGLNFPTASLVGLVLALSSTAFALQLMAERNDLTKRFGRMAFAVLLFQDLAVVPLLAIVPLLGSQGAGSGFPIEATLKAVAILTAVVIAGRFLLRHVLRIVALSQVREILTATALLVVLGTALLMEQAGLSMALGAFLAGVLLADSEFRHQLEADIEPFKGLLLGLFFIAVGMSVNLGLITQQPGQVITIVLLLVAIKFAVLFTLGKWAGLDTASARRLGLVISQGGEFAFVVFGVAVRGGVLQQPLADLLVVGVSLSMMLTPLLLLVDDLLSRKSVSSDNHDPLPDEHPPVIIAGFGRFGQITARVLGAKQISFTALEVSQEQVDFVRKYGATIYYGDASRLDLLQAAGAAKAKLFVLAIDDVDASLRTAKIVRQHFPNLKIMARARNRKHAYELMDLGVETIRRETFLSALDLTTEVLKDLDFSAEAARNAIETFRQHDEKRLHEHRHAHTDDQKMQALAKEATRELEEMFEQDAKDQVCGDAGAS
jgi:monovalent cation:proton antiporter-2 (CPA2) family protein